MTFLVPLLICSLMGVVIVQTLTTLRFLHAIVRPPSPPVTDERCPKTAVILCLRGSDPFLNSCIRAVLDQDYPHFAVRIVVDGMQDPAWDVVRRAMDEHPFRQVTAEALDKPSPTCSLKCSSVVQAIRALDKSFEVIALLDADTIPHRTWLRELVTPLGVSDVAVTTGTRWYIPSQPTLASMVRYLWNAAAAVQMVCFKIAWGGTLAIKRTAIDQVNLLDHWEKAFCEDTMLYRALKKHGLRQVFVPSLMMVNRETCTLAGFCTWVTRQLLTARLYHPGWLATVIHGTVSTVAPLATLGVLASATLQGEWIIVNSLLTGLIFFEMSWLLLLVPCECIMRRIVSRRSEAIGWLTPSAIAKFPAAVLMTQLVYPVTLLRAMLLRGVEWRGVPYRIRGPWNVRREMHQPYACRHPGQVGRSL